MERRFTLVSFLMCMCWVAQAQIFTDVAAQVGIVHSYPGNAGGGVSFCDFTGDGLDDMTLATGDGEFIQFYENIGGTFVALPPLVPHQQEAKHVLWVDFDNDGDKDLYVATHIGPNRLYRNDGNLTFTDITAQAGLPLEDHRTFGACWGDFNRDGWLDLYFTERKWPAGQFINENRLFKNNADGTFTEVTYQASVADADKKPFCAAFLDYDNDKWPDIYIANDKATVNTLLRNNGDGTFTDVSQPTNADLIMDAMCVAVGDYDNDGWLDIYISNIETGNRLLHNLGALNPDNVVFEEVADQVGVGFHSIGWGALFFDGDNDGDLDLYVSGMLAGSNVKSSAYYVNNGDGTFGEPYAGFEGDTVASFNNAIGDFDGNGFPDIMVVNITPYSSQLWKNGSTSNKWIKVELRGVLSNRDGVGSRIEVYTNGHYQMRYTHCGIGFMGQNSGTEIIGLGTAAKADSIIVTWPTGHVDRFYDVSAGERVLLVEGSSTNGDIAVDPDVNIISTVAEAERLPHGLLPYPNPASTVLKLKSEGPLPFTHFAIFDVNGRHLGGSILSDQTVPLDGLQPGLYGLVLWNSRGEKVALSFVKQ